MAWWQAGVRTLQEKSREVRSQPEAIQTASDGKSSRVRRGGALRPFQWNRGVELIVGTRQAVLSTLPKRGRRSPWRTRSPARKSSCAWSLPRLPSPCSRVVVEVGGLFEVRVKVTIASGNPSALRQRHGEYHQGQRVSHGNGRRLRGQVFARRTPAFSTGLMPELGSTRVRTNRAGVARFKLKIALGRGCRALLLDR